MFPAPAGINRRRNNRARSAARVPRASGDKPVVSGLSFTPAVCSPRQRG
ncbi:hypothetical protein C0224_000916 [Escherichia coli]|nr:hypothetical protein [Escherichia coli]EER0919226.1 hypothetical protein [Escherichia coli]EER2726848.1 hypothetical protein [Escherichia coli]EER5778995.1 hypothetical protein [Escherichia coli]EER8599303.1 hypothetical protein [Escherichia coli]